MYYILISNVKVS